MRTKEEILKGEAKKFGLILGDEDLHSCLFKIRNDDYGTIILDAVLEQYQLEAQIEIVEKLEISFLDKTYWSDDAKLTKLKTVLQNQLNQIK